MGNNGAGKTTLLKLMLDLLLPDSGAILLNGQDVRHNEDWKKYTGAFLDESLLVPYLTPAEYFNLIIKFRLGKTGKSYTINSDYTDFANNIIAQRNYIRDLSRGNKQKVGIISTLIGNTKIIILDEPHSGLDPSSQHLFNELISVHYQQNNCIILLSTHHLLHINDIGSRVILLESGRIILDSVNDLGTRTEINNYFKLSGKQL